jgi:transglutaminase superfamily protein
MTLLRYESLIPAGGRTLPSDPAIPVSYAATRDINAALQQPNEASVQSVRWRSVLACMVSIALIKRSLAWRGLARTLERIRDRGKRLAADIDVTPANIAMADRIVAVAAALYPGRALCLERSLVLYDRLRCVGAPVELLIGVQATPFLAHAWVTYMGEPVNDSAEHVSHFVVLPDFRS